MKEKSKEENMKALSIEEKAKRFDEVIEKLRSLHDDYNTVSTLIDVKEELEDICPELKESEDEKMRKSIIYALRNGGFYDNDKTDEAIAWLEKQGEQKADDKAKRYDDLLVKLQEAKVNNDVCDERYCCVIDDIVPELKENEDERIRNALIRFHKSTIDVDGIKGEDILAWLEKQGEQKETPCDKCKKEQPSHSCQDITELGRCALEMQDSQNLANSTKTCKDEQKPAEKTESKFHEGQWITNGEYTWKIVEVKPLDYILQSQDGNIVDDTISYVDKQFHVFTLQDAKDGDVLASATSTFIYQEEYIAEKPIAYCGIINGYFIKGENACWTNERCHPATKEERDVLEKAMVDAGYTFDFEKKELKKVKIENEIEIPFGAKDSELQEVTYFIPKGFHAEINEDNVVIKKGEKPTAWSEEDEKIVAGLNNCIDELEEANGWRFTYVNDENVELCKIKNWLKFLKERVGCEANCTTTKQWKPSKEQIKALERECMAHSNYDLCRLYEQLKKLKG